MTYSHRISESTRHGGRQRREILGIRSSVRQCSARSSPPRRGQVCLPMHMSHVAKEVNWLASVVLQKA